MKKRIGLSILLLLMLGFSIMLFGCKSTSDQNNANNNQDDNTNDTSNICDHSYTDWEIFEDGYCENRIYKRYCTKCQNLEWRHGAAEDHDWSDEITNEPNCTTTGSQHRRCNICSKFDLIKFIDPLGHEYGETYEYNSNSHWNKCIRCSKKSESQDHSYDSEGLCLICGYVNPYFDNPLAGTYNITMWVSERESYDGTYSIVRQMQEQIEAFMEANPGIVINASISGVTEADTGAQVIADIYSAPDIYCVAQDQINRLVQVNALSPLGGAAAEKIRQENDAGSVRSATVNNILYAYPMTSDNGYYMYYDKSIITNPDSLEQIIADVEAYNAAHPNDQRYIRFALENGWYVASFFFGAGCHSGWVIDEEGNFVGVDDNFNSAQGLVAMKGMQKLTQSSCYSSDADNMYDTAVIITGLWNGYAAEEYFGENLGATDLPSFTVDGQTYHLGSFSGNKLMGVKPQIDAKKNEVLHLLAQYLTSEQCQQERYDMWQWGPSNVAVQEFIAPSDIHLSALSAQSAYTYPQGQIHGAWWDISATLGAQAKGAASDDDLTAALNEYEESIHACLKPDPSLFAWSVIGGICNTVWDTDFPMTQVEEGIWESMALNLIAGQEFKLRYGLSWDVQVGANGQVKTPYVEPGNIVVGETGTYVIRLEWDGISEFAKVSFIPAS